MYTRLCVFLLQLIRQQSPTPSRLEAGFIIFLFKFLSSKSERGEICDTWLRLRSRCRQTAPSGEVQSTLIALFRTLLLRTWCHYAHTRSRRRWRSNMVRSAYLIELARFCVQKAAPGELCHCKLWFVDSLMSPRSLIDAYWGRVSSTSTSINTNSIIHGCWFPNVLHGGRMEEDFPVIPE